MQESPRYILNLSAGCNLQIFGCKTGSFWKYMSPLFWKDRFPLFCFGLILWSFCVWCEWLRMSGGDSLQQIIFDKNNIPIEELLGSVTTYNNVEGSQQLRTSARVFKKMRLDSASSATTTTSTTEKKGKIVTCFSIFCCYLQIVLAQCTIAFFNI